MTPEQKQYHLDELAAALNASHPGHILPPAAPAGWRILDVGCGAGQTLIARYGDRISFGLDPDLEALHLGRSLSSRVCFACAKAEFLPYRDGQFDMVTARVSLAYTDMHASLGEIRRVLRAGGRVWMTLHDWKMRYRQAPPGNYRGWMFFAYIVVNSLLFHCTGRNFGLRGRHESFQTESGMRRALAAAGFRDIVITRGKHFVVEAAA